MASKREPKPKDDRNEQRRGETPPVKPGRDPNEIARFERPFERFEDLEDWQQPLRIDDDDQGDDEAIPNRSGSRSS